MNDVKRSKIKIRQLNNEILSLSKRLKKSNRIFDLLIINKEVSISFVSKGKNKDKKYSEKQIKEYNDNSDANYNNLKIGKNKQKDKNNGKNNISDKSTRIKADYKTKSKNKKANNSNLNKNRMHLNYIYKIQRNMTNIMDFINDQNECFTPYHINKIDSGSLKNETKKKIRSRETSPSSQDKLKYSTVIQSNKRNKSQILLNSGGNIEKIKLYRKIKDYHKLFDKKLSQITRNIMPKSIRRTLSAFQHIRNSSPNFYDSYRNLCNNNNINSNNKNSNLSLKRKNKYRQLNKSSSSKNYHNISATSNKKYSINYFRKKTPNKVNSQRKEITPNIKIKNNFHNLCSNSNSKSKMQFNDNLRKSIDNSEQKKQFKKININNANNISAPINNLNSYNSTKDSNKVKNLINKDNILKNANKINNNNIIDGMLNNILIIANIKNKFEVNTVSHGANKHNSFQKFKYNLSGNSVSSNKK